MDISVYISGVDGSNHSIVCSTVADAKAFMATCDHEGSILTVTVSGFNEEGYRLLEALLS